MRATSGRRRQSARATSTGNGYGRTTLAPPDLKPGQVRCPVCRNGARLTVSGHLRGHRDLFGHPCFNRAVAA